jgi:hypothetical protein
LVAALVVVLRGGINFTKSLLMHEAVQSRRLKFGPIVTMVRNRCHDRPRQRHPAVASEPRPNTKVANCQNFRPPRQALRTPEFIPMYSRLTANSSSLCVASSTCGVCIVARCVFSVGEALGASTGAAQRVAGTSADVWSHLGFPQRAVANRSGIAQSRQNGYRG